VDVTTTSIAPGTASRSSKTSKAAGPAHPRAILAIILVSYFLILLDNSVIFTGLPSIASAFDLGPHGLSWVQDAYTLVFGGLLLLGARSGDLLGRRRVFVAGLTVRHRVVPDRRRARRLVADRRPRAAGRRRRRGRALGAVAADRELSRG
jgi:MFS family permease